MRETKEEAGLSVDIKGILSIDSEPGEIHRFRVVYFAEPKDEDDTPKTIAD